MGLILDFHRVLAYAIVAKSPPDGHTLIASVGGFSSTPLFYPNLQFDPVRDFVPLSLLVRSRFMHAGNESQKK